MVTDPNRTEELAKAAWAERAARLRTVLFRGGPLILLLLLVAALAILSPHFLTAGNLLTVARQTAFVAILAVGQTFVIIRGGIDLSVAATAALSAVIVAVLVTEPVLFFGTSIGPLNPVLAVIIGLMVGALAGTWNGYIIARFGIPDFIATLGGMTLFRGLALLVTGGLPVPTFKIGAGAGGGLPDFILWAGQGSIFGIPFLLIAVLIIAITGGLILKFTAFGRSIYAVGGNREAARASGINVGRTTILIYAFSGLMAAIAGILLMGRLSSANALMGEGEELRSIASTVIGGTNLFGGEGGVFGTMIGAAILGVLGNGLNLLNVSPFWQRVVQGAVILLVVVLDQVRRNRLKR